MASRRYRRGRRVRPWLNQLARAVQVTISLVMAVLGFYLACMGEGNQNSAILFVWLFVFLALIVHELGHVISARLCGMTVWRVNISGLEFQAQRRGWRVRRSRIKFRRIGGYVQAFPVLGQPMRPQLIGLSLGGPAGNLVMAVFCGACGWLLLPRHAAFLSLSFAVVNLGSALVNLVPYQGALPSDGLTLLRLLRGLDEKAPNLVCMRLISRSIAGQTADQLPEEEIIALEQQPAPLSLIALWCRLKADQNRGDWVSAASRHNPFKAMEQALVPAQKTASSELLAMLRTEFAFSQAMLTGDGSELAKDALPTSVAWALPWLQPRCQALLASLHGDKARCSELLDISQSKAENSIDRALRSSEVVLREYVAATINEPSPGRRYLQNFA